MKSNLRIIVTGLIAQHPRLGGVTWDYLQYVIGLDRLSHDVYYFEDSGQWPYSHDGGPTGNQWIVNDCKPNVEHLAKIMSRYGLGDRWAYHCPVKPRWFGLSNRRRREVVQSTDLLINVSGTLERPADYRCIPRLVYIDSDPVFTQIKLMLPSGQIKFQRRFRVHDICFSFGENFSDQVPETGFRWRATRQPIVLSEWRPSPPRRDAFTTVMSWTSYKPLVYRRRRYGQKDVEFKHFLDLPGLVGSTVLEVAMSGTRHTNWDGGNVGLPANIAAFIRRHPQWTVQQLLRQYGWRTVDAYSVCSDLDTYRDYIESSKAEWSVAKNGYVRGQAGWFSCRSACYLAAGKPIVVQDTGFSSILPVGEGILTFRTIEEAVAAIHEVEANYARHARRAREIVEEYFDSNKVLTRLIEDALG